MFYLITVEVEIGGNVFIFSDNSNYVQSIESMAFIFNLNDFTIQKTYNLLFLEWDSLGKTLFSFI